MSYDPNHPPQFPPHPSYQPAPVVAPAQKSGPLMWVLLGLIVLTVVGVGVSMTGTKPVDIGPRPSGTDEARYVDYVHDNVAADIPNDTLLKWGAIVCQKIAAGESPSDIVYESPDIASVSYAAMHFLCPESSGQ